jgi:hypothetical protein
MAAEWPPKLLSTSPRLGAPLGDGPSLGLGAEILARRVQTTEKLMERGEAGRGPAGRRTVAPTWPG